MTEDITLDLTPEELKKILLDYYQKLYNDKNITIMFKSKKELVDFFEDEVEELITRIIMERKIKLGNHTATIKNEIEIKDLKEVLNEVLNNNINESDYEIVYLYLKTEDEDSYKSIVFKGLQATLKRKKVKQKIKEL